MSINYGKFHRLKIANFCLKITKQMLMAPFKEPKFTNSAVGVSSSALLGFQWLAVMLCLGCKLKDFIFSNIGISVFQDNSCIVALFFLASDSNQSIEPRFFTANNMAALLKSQANKQRNCGEPPSQQCLLAAAGNKPAGKQVQRGKLRKSRTNSWGQA